MFLDFSGQRLFAACHLLKSRKLEISQSRNQLAKHRIFHEGSLAGLSSSDVRASRGEIPVPAILKINWTRRAARNPTGLKSYKTRTSFVLSQSSFTRFLEWVRYLTVGAIPPDTSDRQLAKDYGEVG